MSHKKFEDLKFRDGTKVRDRIEPFKKTYICKHCNKEIQLAFDEIWVTNTGSAYCSATSEGEGEHEPKGDINGKTT